MGRTRPAEAVGCLRGGQARLHLYDCGNQQGSPGICGSTKESRLGTERWNAWLPVWLSDLLERAGGK